MQYGGIELPLTLLRKYHVYIWPLVESGLENPALLRRLQEEHSLSSFTDVQQALQRKSPVVEDLSRDITRKMLAVSVHFLPFVLEHFPSSAVMVILLSSREETYFPNGKLPRPYRLVKAAEEAREARVDPQVVSQLFKEFDLLLEKHKEHPVFGPPEFRLWLRRLLPVAMKNVHIMRRWIKEEPIRIILSHTEMIDPGTTLALLAAQYNLPFINAPVHLITDRNLLPTRAVYYCAWGENYRVWMQKRGIDRSKIICTGNLRFEYERKKGCLPRKTILAELNLPENHLLFAYTTQPLPDEVKHTLARWISEAIAGLPATVLFKRHPNDHADYEEHTKTGHIVVVPDSIKLYDLLPNINYLMTVSSTTAIEAALLHKGIIVLQPELPYRFDGNSTNYHAHLAKAKAGFVAFSAGSLRKIIARLCKSKKMRIKLVQLTQAFAAQTIHQGALSTPSEEMYRLIQTLLP